MWDSSVHRAHAKVEDAELVAGGVEVREGEVDDQRNGAELRNPHAEPGADRAPEIVELVVGLGGAEIGEEHLMERVGGLPGELIFERAVGPLESADIHSE